jgi:iron complex outermembrane recepter protein
MCRSSPCILYFCWNLSCGGAELAALEPLYVVGGQEEQGTAESESARAVSADRGDLSDLLRLEPGANVAAAPGSVFALRGFIQEGTDVAGTRSNGSISVGLAGVPRSSMSLWVFGVPTWDVDTLRIDFGPVLFSDSAVAQAGEIGMETRSPVFFHEGHIAAEVGEYGYYRGGFTENVVLLRDTLALRLNYSGWGSDGAVTNLTLDDPDFNEVDRQLLRGQLRWRPAGDERSILDFMVESDWGDGNPLGVSSILRGGDLLDRETALNTPTGGESDRQAASFRAKVDLDERRWIEADIAWQQMGGSELSDLDGGPLLKWFRNLDFSEKRLTGGVRMEEESEQVAWRLGLYAESSEYGLDFSGVGFAPFPFGSAYQSGVVDEVRMLAAFGRAERAVYPGVWLAGGLRLDHQQREQASSARFGRRPSVADSTETESTELLPEVGLEWRGSHSKAGFRVSRSYRPAGAAYAASLGASEPYGEERGWEANLYGDQVRDSLSVSWRLFHARLDDQQVPYLAPGGFPGLDQFITNAGSSTRSGGEFKAEWRGPASWRAGVSAAYLHTRYDALVLDGVDRSGQGLPYAPRWTAGVELAWAPVTGWFAGTRLTWQDASYAQVNAPGTTSLEARMLLSARCGYRWRNAEVFVFGDNLLDQSYALTREDPSGAGGGIVGRVGMPRSFGTGFSVRW